MFKNFRIKIRLEHLIDNEIVDVVNIFSISGVFKNVESINDGFWFLSNSFDDFLRSELETTIFEDLEEDEEENPEEIKED